MCQYSVQSNSYKTISFKNHEYYLCVFCEVNPSIIKNYGACLFLSKGAIKNKFLWCNGITLDSSVQGFRFDS